MGRHLAVCQYSITVRMQFVKFHLILIKVESETIESDIVEKSQFQRSTFDHESKYETLMLHARYYYTVIFTYTEQSYWLK